MKKIFSVLLIATFLTYALYVYQAGQTPSAQVPISIGVQPVAVTPGTGSTPSVSAQTTPTATIPTPSTQDNTLQAQGTVQIINTSTNPIFLVKTSRLLTTDGKLYHLAEGVSSPAGSKVQASIYADQNGSASVIGPSKFTFPGLSADLQSSIYAISDSTLVLAQPNSLASAQTTPTQTTTPTATPAPQPVPPTPAPAPTPAPVPKQIGMYKDGTYSGDSIDAYYGYVQVSAVIRSGKLSSINMLDYPRDRRTSQEINGQALPMLISEAISAQSANISDVSGASETSPAFKQSLASALAQAKN